MAKGRQQLAEAANVWSGAGREADERAVGGRSDAVEAVGQGQVGVGVGHRRGDVDDVDGVSVVVDAPGEECPADRRTGVVYHVAVEPAEDRLARFSTWEVAPLGGWEHDVVPVGVPGREA